MGEKREMETEAMLIRPPKELADQLRKLAVERTVKSGKTVTPNKVAVTLLSETLAGMRRVK